MSYEDTPQVAATVDDKSIAVLPFVNMSDDPSNEYFSEGMSEELLNLLAKIPDLKVIGRTSSLQFKGQNEDLRVIGEKLGVANILEGSVRKSGNTVRVTAQLISTDDGTHLWSDSFDRNLDDIFRVQDEIANSVVETLRVKLLGDGITPRPTPGNSEAYDLYLKGRYFCRQLGEDRLERTREFYNRALDLDPEFALAWYGLSSVYINEILGGERTTGEHVHERPAHAGLAVTLHGAEMFLDAVHDFVGFDAAHVEQKLAEGAHRRAIGKPPSVME